MNGKADTTLKNTTCIGKGRSRSRDARSRRDRIFVVLCVCAASLSVVTLLVLLGSILFAGMGNLSWQFLSGKPSRFVEQAGIWPAMAGTVAICTVCFITAVPIGLSTAILLEEYRPANRWLQKLHALVQLNITNLAGVPSIVYGILGLTVFVQFFNLMGNQQSPVLEFGATYYDRFTLVDGSSVRVRIDDHDAPASVPTSGVAYVDDQGNPRTVVVVPAEQIGAQVTQQEVNLDQFEALLEGEIDSLRAMDSTALSKALADNWSKAGLQTDLAVVAPGLTAQVQQGIALPGRDGKKALRARIKSLASSLAAEAFPNTLVSDAPSSRILEPAPWYLRVPFGRSVLAGGLTLMLVILPIIIISTQEALRSISNTQRQASLALGATKWQTIWNVTLPSAIPGVMTGVILAMSRAIGEAAPVLIIAGIVFITFTPRHLMDDFTAMPLQIYQWASLPQAEFHALAAAGIILLLAVLLVFNTLAIVIRQRTQKQG